MIRTLTADIEADRADFILTHEHVYCNFGATSGDPDLAFTAEQAVAADLIEARQEGANLLVEVSTYDMGASPSRTAALCDAVGLLVVKSTGWFRSPWLDPLVEAQTTDALTARLIADLCDGFAETRFRAGVIGEVGLQGSTPTRTERAALDAAAAASLATGAGIIAHTDDWENARAILRELTRRGVRQARIMLAHARCADPVTAQCELADAGVTLAFDQLGHPQRDAVPAVAERVEELLARGYGGRLAVSSDVGRLSRLRSAGGSGYMRAVRDLFAELLVRGVDQKVVDGLARVAPARFLTWSISEGGS